MPLIPVTKYQPRGFDVSSVVNVPAAFNPVSASNEKVYSPAETGVADAVRNAAIAT